MNPEVITGVLLVGLALSLFILETSRMLAAEKVKSRSPFTEKMLRPAGESLRLKVDELRDELTENCMIVGLLLLTPGVALMLMDASTIPGLIGWAIIAGIALSFAWSFWKEVRSLREDLRNHRLGFEGERYVGSELSHLIAKGYSVFHDFVVDWRPGGEDTDFNIDHIVVGPEGVFAIETKAIRKWSEGDAGKTVAHVVEYDGDCLIFSHRTDQRMVNQSRSTAETLSKWLTGSSSERVEVIPALVIPGWYVKRTGRGVVRVFSGKEVGGSLPANGRKGALTAGEIQRISDRIEAHCRNVEG